MSLNETDSSDVVTDNEAALKSLIKERIVIMDGAMGTMLQQEKLDERDFSGEKGVGLQASIREKIDSANPQNLLLFLVEVNKRLVGEQVLSIHDYNLYLFHQMDQKKLLEKIIVLPITTIV